MLKLYVWIWRYADDTLIIYEIALIIYEIALYVRASIRLICEQFINTNTRPIEYTPSQWLVYCSVAKAKWHSLQLVKYDITLYNCFIYVIYLQNSGKVY